MEPRLVVYTLGVVILVAASLTAMANQSGRFVGVHEVPPFVTERVEIVPKADDRGSPVPAPGRVAPAKIDPNPVRS